MCLFSYSSFMTRKIILIRVNDKNTISRRRRKKQHHKSQPPRPTKKRRTKFTYTNSETEYAMPMLIFLKFSQNYYSTIVQFIYDTFRYFNNKYQRYELVIIIYSFFCRFVFLCFVFYFMYLCM